MGDAGCTSVGAWLLLFISIWSGPSVDSVSLAAAMWAGVDGGLQLCGMCRALRALGPRFEPTNDAGMWLRPGGFADWGVGPRRAFTEGWCVCLGL